MGKTKKSPKYKKDKSDFKGYKNIKADSDLIELIKESHRLLRRIKRRETKGE